MGSLYCPADKFLLCYLNFKLHTNFKLNTFNAFIMYLIFHILGFLLHLHDEKGVSLNYMSLCSRVRFQMGFKGM